MRGKKRVRRWFHAEDGATAIEYAVMLSLICGAVIGSVGVLSNSLRDSFNRSGDAVNTVLNPAM